LVGHQKGCDFELCESKVCECDSYCCDTSWDLSCRGIPPGEADLKDAYFIGCSASNLCCEPPDAPKPLGLLLPIDDETMGDEAVKLHINCDVEGWYAPSYSNCWNYNEEPSASGMIEFQKGCDHDLCKEAVCACDSYCCDISWDLSCRGIPVKKLNIEDTYYISECSASLLCCEPDDAPNPILSMLPHEAVEIPVMTDCKTGNWHAPTDSNCWSFVEQPGTTGDQKGCDYNPCEQAVCACDSYCCDVSWDLSCRGIPTKELNLEDAYLIGSCSASLLCCEPDDAPDPVDISQSEAVESSITISAPSKNEPILDNAQWELVPICEKENWYAPSYSNCWKYNEPNGSNLIITENQKGCDHDLCEQEVCACDSYCCEVSWDLSCRGIQVEDNYFVEGCSASVLCCEPTDAPKPILPSDAGEVDMHVISDTNQWKLMNDCKNENWRAPDDSNCWNYNEHLNTSPSDIAELQKGCDYDLCEQAVCACDSYCCEASWDLSCRGGIPEKYYFIGGCSASVLCCENIEASENVDASPPETIEIHQTTKKPELVAVPLPEDPVIFPDPVVFPDPDYVEPDYPRSSEMESGKSSTSYRIALFLVFTSICVHI